MKRAEEIKASLSKPAEDRYVLRHASTFGLANSKQPSSFSSFCVPFSNMGCSRWLHVLVVLEFRLVLKKQEEEGRRGRRKQR